MKKLLTLVALFSIASLLNASDDLALRDTAVSADLVGRDGGEVGGPGQEVGRPGGARGAILVPSYTGDYGPLAARVQGAPVIAVPPTAIR